jgi:hypothetical protein
MPDRRIENLREALLKAGVAPRHVRRAVLEIDGHFHQLVDDALARGESEDDARTEARDLLGTDQTLIQRYAGAPELQAWSSRWTAVWFTLVPLVIFAALFVVTGALLYLIVDQMSPYLHHVHVSARASYLVDLAVRIVFLWAMPLSVAGAFAILAYRRRVAPRWPVAGIITLCALVSLINVNVVLTGGATPGEAGAGIGTSADSLPGQTAHAVVIAMLVLGPLWFALRRFGRHRPMLID